MSLLVNLNTEHHHIILYQIITKQNCKENGTGQANRQERDHIQLSDVRIDDNDNDVRNVLAPHDARPLSRAMSDKRGRQAPRGGQRLCKQLCTAADGDGWAVEAVECGDGGVCGHEHSGCVYESGVVLHNGAMDRVVMGTTPIVVVLDPHQHVVCDSDVHEYAGGICGDASRYLFVRISLHTPGSMIYLMPEGLC